ncbi:MAG: hypothetical protein QXT73_00720 [Candidatus Methanomethylicaceae archaeon]
MGTSICAHFVVWLNLAFVIFLVAAIITVALLTKINDRRRREEIAELRSTNLRVQLTLDEIFEKMLRLHPELRQIECRKREDEG